MQLTTKALVIKTMDISDNDRLLTLLTSEYGVVKAFASGAKKIKSKNYAATSMFAYSDFLLTEKGNTYKVKESSLIKSFFKIGCDIKTLSLMQYFCELCAVIITEDISVESLRLILNTFHYLNEGALNSNIIKSIVEFRLLSIAGYMPDLLQCANCSKNDENSTYYLDYAGGCIYCEKCAAGDVSSLQPLNATLLSALKHIAYCEFERLFLFKLPDEMAEILSKITEKYLLNQIEHSFKTLDFYYSIL